MKKDNKKSTSGDRTTSHVSKQYVDRPSDLTDPDIYDSEIQQFNDLTTIAPFFLLLSLSSS